MGTLITTWSATSPFGDRRDAFADGVRAGRPAPLAESSDDWHPAPDRGRVVPAFDIVERLGRKGTSSMDRTTALAVHTVGGLVKADAGAVDERTGVVLGTTSGSAQTQFAFTGDSLTRRKPYFVNPAQLPV